MFVPKCRYVEVLQHYYRCSFGFVHTYTADIKSLVEDFDTGKL